MKRRLDIELVLRKFVTTRSQAESYIKLGSVLVNGRTITKSGHPVGSEDNIVMTQDQQYVSRAGLKLASVARMLELEFSGRVVLDVGSSTGGFTDYALKSGAKKVIAVDVGTNQLHPTLRGHEQIELHEQTDIRSLKKLSSKPDIVVIDVSFISLREILPHVRSLIANDCIVAAMVKPQFEAQNSNVKHKGIVKNEKLRREIFKDFELWVKQYFLIVNKKDSDVSGEKGNTERFYLLKKIK